MSDLGLLLNAQSGFSFPQQLTEKYAPQTIDDFVGLDKPKKIMRADRESATECLLLGNPMASYNPSNRCVSSVANKFKLSIGSLKSIDARANLQQQFDVHKCKHEDTCQAAARVREAPK